MARITRTIGPEIGWMAGQSNSLGQQTLPSVSDGTIPRSAIRYWHHDMVGANPTATRDLDDVATADWQGGEVEIGVRMVDTSSRGPYAVAKTAVGSSGLVSGSRYWLGAGQMASKAIASVRAMIDTLVWEDPTQLPVVGSVVWNQWEEDGKTANDPDADNYAANLALLIQRFRDEFHPQLPVVVTLASTAATSRPAGNITTIRAAQAAVAAADALVTTIETNALALEVDVTHYTADSQQALGVLSAAALAGFALPDYTDTSLVTRVSLYGSLASAQDASRFLSVLGEGGGAVMTGPVDTDVWAVSDPIFGHHFVPTGAWS